MVKTKNEKSRDWYAKNIERERKKRRARYFLNKERYDLLTRNYYKKIKLDVLRHYSAGTMACSCCQENHIEFLSLDHINGNGAEHRREGLRGYKLYLWIIKNNYPPEFRILCYNCNQSRGQFGTCPHEEERKRLVAKAKLEAENK